MMLRRNLRDTYQSFTPTQSQKDAIFDEIQEVRPRGKEMKGRKWKARGQLGAWIVILILVLMVLGAGAYAAYHFGLIAYISEALTPDPTVPEVTEPSETPEAAEPSSEETDPPETEPAPYEELIGKYTQAIEQKWEMEQCEEADISYMVMFLEDPQQLSYCKTDLDGDGITELLITDGNVIYDLYTYIDEAFVHLFSSGERNSYTLTSDKVIVNVGSNGAASTVYTFYRYFGGNLIVDQMVIFDADKDPQNPWFRGFGDIEAAEPISEADARAIIDAHPASQIACAPITEYE